MYGNWRIFYKQLLGIDNNSNDEIHQFIISEGTTLSVYNDGTEKNNQNQSTAYVVLFILDKVLKNLIIFLTDE
jgi:hypothetical protein